MTPSLRFKSEAFFRMLTEKIITKDGSMTLYRSDIDETYHSVHGAVTESEHVFIKEGFYRTIEQNRTVLNILEVGFGTGLNALLTLKAAAEKQVKVSYITLEPYPIDAKTAFDLHYAQHINWPEGDGFFRQLHDCDWHTETEVSDTFFFTKEKTELASFSENFKADLVYYDAFAPTKQPEMWTPACFRKLRSLMRIGGIIVTYCAQGQFRRDLAGCGFSIESLPGPPGKREMTRCTNTAAGLT